MKIYHWILLFLLALVVSMAYQYTLRHPTENTPLPGETAPTLTLPKGGITSDPFSLKLLQAALRTDRGNILLAPRPLAATLSDLRPLSTGKTAAALDALSLPRNNTPNDAHSSSTTDAQAPSPSSPEPETVNVLFGDIGLDDTDAIRTDSFIRIPFSTHPAESINLVNNILSEQTDGRISYVVTGDDINTNTRLLSITGANFTGEWLVPFSPQATKPADFFNANGGMPRVRMMTCRGSLRLARAEDGTWQAVALFLRRTTPRADSTCFVAILPRGDSARDFARHLTPERLTAIRTALAHATPVEATIDLPLLPLRPPAQNLRPLLRQLGLDNLFTPEAELLLKEGGKPVFLSAALQQCSVLLTETGKPTSPTEAPHPPAAEHSDTPTENHPTTGETLTFNRPFLWFIGDLTSPAPPWYLGIIENM